MLSYELSSQEIFFILGLLVVGGLIWLALFLEEKALASIEKYTSYDALVEQNQWQCQKSLHP